MYFHMSYHYKKIMKSQKNGQSKAEIAKMLHDLYKDILLKMYEIIKQAKTIR